MKSLQAPTIVAVVCLTIAGSMTFAGDGFQWPDLNPFDKPAATQSRPTPNKPSRLSTWSRNTRRSVSNATRWMNPWSKPATPPPRPSMTGSQRVTNRTRTEPQSEGNWFTRMFKKEEEPPRTATLSDFVGGERPTF